LGAEHPAPVIADARAACRIVTAASLVSFLATLLVVLVWHAR
jgi:hypothetical protein